ncbi:hypothetical protein JAAARDRAFT_43173 [Jaapia argillacea MUCL 33604]|uniref:Uncharacterized protein n=1 Tax=Jaapia argillacea MUCL 33604 TaxID=933084 RepID=A0A067P2A8_9AGAM|nr:hypothetical protein JAAARDRAFT_43173 [Jaapia argillacea MUCL 33604]
MVPSSPIVAQMSSALALFPSPLASEDSQAIIRAIDSVLRSGVASCQDIRRIIIMVLRSSGRSSLSNLQLLVCCCGSDPLAIYFASYTSVFILQPNSSSSGSRSPHQIAS